MTTADKSLCEELYKISGLGHEVGSQLSTWRDAHDPRAITDIPMYDLDYVLDKLPHKITDQDDVQPETFNLGMWKGESGYSIGYGDAEGGMAYIGEYDVEMFFIADTPANAAAKLCIALFKQNILTAEGAGDE